MNEGLQGSVSQVAESQDNCRTVCPSRSNSGDDSRARPSTLRRFPQELEILIEVWGIDRNEISPSAWVAAPASDEWDLLNRLRCLNCMVAWDRLLGSTVSDRRWPTWFEFGEAYA
jgi:hypothetical protein